MRPRPGSIHGPCIAVRRCSKRIGHVWLGNIPVAVLEPAGSGDAVAYLVHADHPDTPCLVIDRQGNHRWRWLSKPFGTTAAQEDPDTPRSPRHWPHRPDQYVWLSQMTT